ncbi:hypothetical protein HDV63DRAFT_400210 [Trichoderma sp. SZMC 28014]
MFGRRRRPILGAAVLVGASSVAAKHAVQRQEMASSQREMEIQYQVDARRREEEEQDRRTQRAVEEALKKSAAENQTAQQQQAAVTSPPPQQQQMYNNPMPIQGQDSGYLSPGQQQAYMMPNMQQPEQLMRAPSPHPPAYYLSASPAPDARPKSAQGIGSSEPAHQELKTRYCTQCGFACRDGDRFCGGCGAKQGPQDTSYLI